MLNKEKVEQLDCVYIPSTNPETFDGLLQLIGKIHIAKIGSIGGSADLKAITEVMKLAKDNMVLTENQVAGSKWKLNQMLFEVLYPMSADISTEDDTPNTCVVRISKGDWSAILTGEMTEAIGTKLVQRNKLSPTTVLIATNGAPNGSFGSDFLDAVKAERIIAGKRSVDVGSGVMAKNSVKTSGTITITVSGKKPDQQ
jgi:beta-lactamase superfamily II metal-dependent hydrolase